MKKPSIVLFLNAYFIVRLELLSQQIKGLFNTYWQNHPEDNESEFVKEEAEVRYTPDQLTLLTNIKKLPQLPF